ncbi:MAG: carbohydrate ABC transporter substrate-binding protein [Epulopiscium sp.]|nr:carbohydrate ABC transporter substrate-binding protein [Candidatus Epulonipiscium sp.]
MKKRMVFLVVLVLSMVLTGCGEKTSQANKNSGKIDLSLWYWNRALDDDLLEQVNEKFPEVNLMPEKIGGDFKVKVITTIAAGSGLPDILCLNDWVGDLLSNPDKFVNLLEEPCNAGEIEDRFLNWKWSMALTPDKNNLIALPLDTGPTAFFYRADLFEQAGLPADPEKVGEQIKTWEDLFQAGEKIVEKTDAKMFENIGRIFIYSLSQQDQLYLDENNQFIGDQDHVKECFDLAVKAYQEGLIYGVDNWTPEWNAAMNNGDIASFNGAVWMKKIIKDAAPDTAGTWRVADMPGGPGNNGGSFISIPKSTKHVKECWDIIHWLTMSENNVVQLKTIDLFPSTPKAFEDESIYFKEDFFGGQETNRIFSKAASNIPVVYIGIKSDAFQDNFVEQLKLVAEQNKDPEKAWKDAVEKCKAELTR